MRAALLMVLAVGLVGALAGPVGAQTCPNAGHAGIVDCPPGEPGTSPTPGPQVAGKTVSRGGGLPLTGADVVQLVVAGAMALGAGIVLVTHSRRRRAVV